MIEIREFLPTEIEAYCKIRLRALEENPEAFLTTAQGFRNRPKAQHITRVQRNYDSPDECMLGAFDGDEPLGMMGVIRARADKIHHIADIVAVFVTPEYRGQKIAGRLLDTSIAYARTMIGLDWCFSYKTQSSYSGSESPVYGAPPQSSRNLVYFTPHS